MDLGNLIAPIATFILGIGAVWTFLAKFTPAAKKYIGIAASSLALLDKVLKAIEDQKVDDAEIQAIREEANKLIISLKR